jgi:acetyl-CoA acetyltransferase family protein
MSQPQRPVIAAAVRTPIGRRAGALAAVHPADLLALVMREALHRSGVAPGDVDQVIAGCVTQAGDQALNIGRTAWLAAGLPDTVPATTIDAQCGSSQQAVNLAASLVASGAAEVVLAGGVESMSRLPLRTAAECGPGDPYPESYRDRFELVSQGESAERIADLWDISRDECDEIALRSQELALGARDAGWFDAELVPVATAAGTVGRDEGIRASTKDGLAALRPLFRTGGRHTAGNSSQISDGAAVVIVAAEGWVRQRGGPLLARIIDQAIVGVDPVIKLTGPIPATRRILSRTGLTLADIDRFEVNEAFASVLAAWSKELGAPLDRTNVNGGAIALGHPVGATGARLVTSIVHDLARNGGGRGLVTMCCGGGLGVATVLAVGAR